MQAGQLRHRVTIQQNTPSRDTYGEEIESWSALATVWAAVEPLAGTERYAADGAQTLATVDTRIRIRYWSGITPGMRVLFGARTFDIQAVIHLEERQQELHLLCEERPDA